MDKVTVGVCTEYSKKCGGCVRYGAREVVESLDLWVQANPEIAPYVEIQAVSCLGVCGKGVAAEILPKDKIIKKVTFKNLHRVKSLILKRVKKVIKKLKKSSSRDLVLTS